MHPNVPLSSPPAVLEPASPVTPPPPPIPDTAVEEEAVDEAEEEEALAHRLLHTKRHLPAWGEVPPGWKRARTRRPVRHSGQGPYLPPVPDLPPARRGEGRGDGVMAPVPVPVVMGIVQMSLGVLPLVFFLGGCLTGVLGGAVAAEGEAGVGRRAGLAIRPVRTRWWRPWLGVEGGGIVGGGGASGGRLSSFRFVLAGQVREERLGEGEARRGRGRKKKMQKMEEEGEAGLPVEAESVGCRVCRKMECNDFSIPTECRKV